jgi:phosphoribosylformylglycinamidine (FGAM) synthase PurS component
MSVRYPSKPSFQARTASSVGQSERSRYAIDSVIAARSVFAAWNPVDVGEAVDEGRPGTGLKLLALMIFEAAIDLSIPDNTAYTVLVALRQLGYDRLERVERSELLRLSLLDGSPSPDIARALTRAEVVFNPNKHRLSYAVDAALESGVPDEWEAVVSDRDDDTTRLARLLTERFGLAELKRVDRSAAWRLFEAGRPAPKERLEWACRALLCNPFSQSATVRARPRRRAVGEGQAFVER